MVWCQPVLQPVVVYSFLFSIFSLYPDRFGRHRKITWVASRIYRKAHDGTQLHLGWHPGSPQMQPRSGVLPYTGMNFSMSTDNNGSPVINWTFPASSDVLNPLWQCSSNFTCWCSAIASVSEGCDEKIVVLSFKQREEICKHILQGIIYEIDGMKLCIQLYTYVLSFSASFVSSHEHILVVYISRMTVWYPLGLCVLNIKVYN